MSAPLEDRDGMAGGDFAPDERMELEDPATTRLKSAVTKRKGRGFSAADEAGGLETVSHFERLGEESHGHAQRSVAGWVLFVKGLDEETNEEQLHERLCDFGTVQNLKLNMDRRTGYVKGYALVEYASYEEAQAAVDELNGSAFMNGTLSADFAFVKTPTGGMDSR